MNPWVVWGIPRDEQGTLNEGLNLYQHTKSLPSTNVIHTPTTIPEFHSSWISTRKRQKWRICAFDTLGERSMIMAALKQIACQSWEPVFVQVGLSFDCRSSLEIFMFFRDCHY